MEILRSILMEIWKGDYTAFLELQESYLHIPILQGHCHFLRFSYAGSHSQFKALPFDLASAPRVFTKVLFTLMAHAHLQGIVAFLYFDDVLLRAPSLRLAQLHLNQMVDCLSSLGFIVNYEKSCLFPAQHILHLGAIID